MNWAELLQGLKEATWTENYTNIDDEKFYSWLSRSHKFVADKVKATIDSKFFFTQVKADAVSWQYKYSDLPVSVIDKVFVKYDWDVNYRPTTPVDVSEKKYDIEYYAENQSKWNPLCFITNNIVMIFPKPDADIVKWIYVTWKKKVWNISATTTEDEVFNWADLDHEVIIDWAKEFVYDYLKEYDKKQEAKDSFYNSWRLKQPWSLDSMISSLSWRWSQPVQYIEDEETLYSLM